MAVNPYALDQLKRLSQQAPYQPELDSSQQDPNVQRYTLDQQFADEAKDRMLSNQRAAAASAAIPNPVVAQRTGAAYGGEAAAMKNLLSSYQQDIDESPITQGIAEADKYRQGERQAILSGYQGGQSQGQPYQNPIQQQQQAASAMESAKINAPVEAAKAKSAGDLAAQEAQSQGLRDVAKINSDSLASQYAALQNALQGGNSAAISGITMPKGGGHVSFQTPAQQAAGSTVPPQLMRDITTTRYNLQKAGPSKGNFLTDMFGVKMGATPEKVAYDQSVAAGLQSLPNVDQGLKDLATFVGENPDLDALSAEQLMQHPKVQGAFDLTGATAEELQQLNQLLYIVRGMPAPADSQQPFWAGQ
jgi:hypothetical protein